MRGVAAAYIDYDRVFSNTPKSFLKTEFSGDRFQEWLFHDILCFMRLVIILLVALILRLLLTYNHLQDPVFQIQFVDSRLFPGYPLLLRLFGSSLENSIVIFNLITKNIFLTLYFFKQKSYAQS